MKCEFEFQFTVEHSIRDISKQLGVDKETLDNMGEMELRDLYANGAYGAETGEITVDDEYQDAPEYYADNDELYALFDATYTVVTEGKNLNECRRKAEELFDNANFGDYEYLDRDYEMTGNIIEQTYEVCFVVEGYVCDDIASIGAVECNGTEYNEDEDCYYLKDGRVYYSVDAENPLEAREKGEMMLHDDTFYDLNVTNLSLEHVSLYNENGLDVYWYEGDFNEFKKDKSKADVERE